MVEFQTLAADSGWNETAFEKKFRMGLNNHLNDELVCRDQSADLHSLSLTLNLLLSIGLDNRSQEPQREKKARTASNLTVSSVFKRCYTTWAHGITHAAGQDTPQQCGVRAKDPAWQLFYRKNGHFKSTCPLQLKTKSGSPMNLGVLVSLTSNKELPVHTLQFTYSTLVTATMWFRCWW